MVALGQYPKTRQLQKWNLAWEAQVEVTLTTAKKAVEWWAFRSCSQDIAARYEVTLMKARYYLVGSLTVFLVSGALFAQSSISPCGVAVKPERSRNGYREIRPSLCEGEFARDVSSSLELVSLTEGRPPIPPGAEMVFDWT